MNDYKNECVRPDYYEQLVDIRRLLKKVFHGYPFLRCQETTRLLYEILNLEELAGEYTPKKSFHAWNYDSRLGLYIDLTQDQFNDNLDEICILPDSTTLLKEIPKETKYQREYDDKNFSQQIEMLVSVYNRGLF